MVVIECVNEKTDIEIIEDGSFFALNGELYMKIGIVDNFTNKIKVYNINSIKFKDFQAGWKVQKVKNVNISYEL